jgi:hypothetical protein
MFRRFILLVFSLPECALALRRRADLEFRALISVWDEPRHVYRLLLLLFAKPFSTVVLICGSASPFCPAMNDAMLLGRFLLLLLLFFWVPNSLGC